MTVSPTAASAVMANTEAVPGTLYDAASKNLHVVHRAHANGRSVTTVTQRNCCHCSHKNSVASRGVKAQRFRQCLYRPSLSVVMYAGGSFTATGVPMGTRAPA